MVDLLNYITPDSVMALNGKSYDKILKLMVNDCLGSFSDDIQKQVIAEIRNKSRSKTPLDINLGGGFALVHAKNSSVDGIYLKIGLLPEKQHLLKGDDIHTLICIILSDNQSRIYLSLLAKLGRMLNQPGAGDVFLSAGRCLAGGDREECEKIILDYVKDFEKD